MPKRSTTRSSQRQVKRQRRLVEEDEAYEENHEADNYDSQPVLYEEDEIQPAPSPARRRARRAPQPVTTNDPSEYEEDVISPLPIEKKPSKMDVEPSEPHSFRQDEEEYEEGDEESFEPNSEGQPRLRKSSGFATCGILDSIEMYRFMCHSRFKISFGPNVNIINGENGSGKSAIVAALQVGLQGSARDTERGSKIQDLIQHNKNDAIVHINILNYRNEDLSQDMSYKHDVYGDMITIERRLRRHGNHSWGVKGRRTRNITLPEGVTPSREVQNIVDHFGFMVKNPVSILTQTKSKTFLAGQKPTQHFQFYREATLLGPLEEELKMTIKVTEDIRDILRRTEEGMPESDRKLAKLEANYRDSEAMKNIDRTIRNAEILSAWVIVQETDKKRLEYEQKTHDDIAPRAEKLSFEVDRTGKKLESFSSQRDDLHQKVDAASGRVQQFNKTYQDTRRQIIKVETDIKSHKRRLTEIESDVNDADKRIIETNARMEQARKDHFAGQEQKSRLIQELQSLDMREKELNETIQSSQAKDSALLEDKYYKEQNLQNAKTEYDRWRTELDDKRRTHLRDTARATNRTGLARFGEEVVEIARRIKQRGREFSHMPVGPIAHYVKLLDHSWAGAIEVALGRHLLLTYIVHDTKDAILLKSIFPRRFKPNVLISNLRRGRYDIGHGDMPALQQYDRYRTILETMEVRNDAVFNALVDMAKVEKNVLSSEDDVKRLAWKRVPNVHMVWNKHGDRAYIRNGSNTFRHAPQNVCARYLSKDMGPYLAALEEQVKQADQEKRKCEENLAARSRELNDLLKEVTRVQTDIHNSKTELTELHRKKNTIEDQLNYAENAFDPEPFEREIADLENLKKSHDIRRNNERNEVQHCEETKTTLQDDLRRIKAESETFRNEAASLTESLEQINQEVARVKSRHRNLKVESAQAAERLAQAHNELNIQRKKVVDYTEVARSLGPCPEDVDWSKWSSEKAQRRVKNTPRATANGAEAKRG
ncbi:Structural maintenance of chromosomes protein 6 [Gracilariopsis chorda]|uniref:Structural maintenance of chromosomes protein 6 n=1 Tax=Gracilariopsis chorda TaxID=448386 RepID=A0A2V3J4Q2_9FLOR|nr:Structural maintenance of chromosomes protein 6 [Gracilariopsis chorda]|eukprot:PXF48350.1 Structural maintenance of chromosomes protein 6 [Gracilariopsis chorda]